MGQSCCHYGSDNTRGKKKGIPFFHQSWVVSGMDCPDCVKKLQSALENTREIDMAVVGFSTRKLQVAYSHGISRALGAATVESVVCKLGFGLEPLGKTESSTVLQPWLRKSVLIYWTGIIVLFVVAALLWQINQTASHIFFSVATLWGLSPVIKKAWYQTCGGVFFGIETLTSVACIGALFLGDYAEAVMVLVLFRLGEYLEGFAAGKAHKGVKSLMALAPDTAFLLQGDERREVPASTLLPGDIIELRPGDRLPVDGELLEAASLDQSMLTGESLPVEKQASEQVMAGTMVVGHRIRIKVTSEPGNNAIDRILHLIEEAESHKAPVERFIDKFSRRYTPVMMTLAIFTALVPPLFFGGAWGVWIYRALALLLIACPCALVISTPAAITSALASAAKTGGLVKGGAVLEKLAAIKRVAFDKTGTLTEGQLTISSLFNVSGDDRWLSDATAVEEGSSHPLAMAIVMEAENQRIDFPTASYVRTIVGKGVTGVVNRRMVTVASPRYLSGHVPNFAENSEALRWIQIQESAGNTVVGVCVDQKLSGLIALNDKIRQDAPQALDLLREIGVKSVMLTGDNKRSAAHIADTLGIDFEAELLPEDKVATIARLQSAGKVVMVGDGINDAPALKTADVGIAMGKGSDTALEVADAALTYEYLPNLVGMIKLSQLTHKIIRQNIAWALGIKLVVLMTTLLGVTGLMIAVLADAGAAAAITLNSLRLLRR